MSDLNECQRLSFDLICFDFQSLRLWAIARNGSTRRPVNKIVIIARKVRGDCHWGPEKERACSTGYPGWCFPCCSLCLTSLTGWSTWKRPRPTLVNWTFSTTNYAWNDTQLIVELTNRITFEIDVFFNMSNYMEKISNKPEQYQVNFRE